MGGGGQGAGRWRGQPRGLTPAAPWFPRVGRAQAHRTSSPRSAPSVWVSLPSPDPASGHFSSICRPSPPPPRFPRAPGSAASDSASPSLLSPRRLSLGSQTAADTPAPRTTGPSARLSVPLLPRLGHARGPGGFVLPAPWPLCTAGLPDPHQPLPVAPNAPPASDCPVRPHTPHTSSQGPASAGGARSEGARGPGVPGISSLSAASSRRSDLGQREGSGQSPGGGGRCAHRSIMATGSGPHTEGAGSSAWTRTSRCEPVR